ncbi:hypothetical protein [Helicobacter cetorum]|uniref:hypothetical protein n=1 Tax=Helicobacter cetorum TaxID=138563 RepID=UPI0012DD8326|nr:hypothetical protein [Helicobacter cetorum]
MKKLSLKEPLVFFENHLVKRINGVVFLAALYKSLNQKRESIKQQSFFYRKGL